MTQGLWRSALVLGLLSLVAPFAIDMYLPAMPEIAADFGVGEAEIQATITAYFIAFGVAQMIYGPWADQAGRKIPTLVGLAVFLLGSAGAALSGSSLELVAWRFVQGLGGAALMVLPRAIIRDLYTGAAATKLMALIMLVISVSPMLAPLAGSIVVAAAGWRAIFWIISAATVLSLAITMLGLPETLRRDMRVPLDLRVLARGVRELLQDRNFLAYTFIGAFGISAFFVFIASAAFVYRGQYGLGPTEFALAFAVNAIGFIGASQVAGLLAERFPLGRVIRGGTGIFAASALSLLAVTLATEAPLYLVAALMLFAFAGFGLVYPTTLVMALDEHGCNAGLASSFGGTLQMFTGGLMIVLTGPVFDGTVVPMAAVIAACATISFLLTLAVRVRY
ncbi:multidrug effflux MFS transporter [Nisaea acidiphila]|uniref:Bcr/CflA family efflux transporter n=1 Tax=Nisaea acidiphila TaxID=1862145 RepID=A0A9J7AYI5_9PROT|nr:multidrug effflux MFS transporter [Nisaea acidiphila]UUX51332.1 multidrug effflux MFS transporter [Nisaea acidiphila]